jgi:hypothetical protein
MSRQQIDEVLGNISITADHGVPTHTPPVGSVYTDLDTGRVYARKQVNAAEVTWVVSADLPVSSGANKVLFDDGATQDWSGSPTLAALRLGGNTNLGSITTIVHQLSSPQNAALGVSAIAEDAAGGYPTVAYFQAELPSGLSHDISGLTGAYAYVGPTVPSGRTISSVYGFQANVENSGPGTIGTLRGLYTQADNYGGGHVDLAEVVTGYLYTGGGTYGSGAIFAGYFSGGTASSYDNLYGIWLSDLSGATADNPYAFWYDAPGVYRIKADGVMAYYNPSFTKYTPGAVNFERVVQQWNGDVIEYGAEAGGTGTLRKVRLLGAGLLTSATILPTSNPGVAGQLWNDNNTVKVSTG